MYSNMYSNIVVGTDGSETAKAAVGRVFALARLDGANVHVVHAFKLPTANVSVGALGDPVVPASVVNAADAVLADAAADDDGVSVKTYVVSGAPADALIQIAEQVDADVIAVGSKRMQSVHRLIGSVPNSMTHNTPSDVLIVKTA